MRKSGFVPPEFARVFLYGETSCIRLREVETKSAQENCLSSDSESTRRKFLHLTTAGIAGAAAGAATTLSAQEAPKNASASGPFARFDVRAFGAKGDGAMVDTPAINRAIEAAASAGGGTVHFPAGTYLCYTIRLKSKVALFLDQGTTILAAETGPGGQYDAAEPNQWDHYQDYGHSHWRNSLIVGEDLHDFSIVGPGLIWGKGLSRGTRQGPRAETRRPRAVPQSGSTRLRRVRPRRPHDRCGHG